MRKLFSAVILSVAMFSATSVFAQQTTAPNSGIASGSSYNWAGYVAQGSGFTGVSGSWVVPTITAPNAASADATWVGIGGVGANDLIQTGTQAVVSGSGQVQYSAWYEVLPSYSQTIPVTVSAGDSITASINQTSPGQWSVNLTDNTNGQHYQNTIAYNSSMSSAEWIEEMPSVGRGTFLGLDNFGSINFTGSSAVQNGQQLTMQQLNAQGMTMLNSGQQALATVSPINSDGQGFTVTRTQVSSSSYGGGFTIGRTRRGGNGLSGFSGFTRGRGGRRVLSFGSRGFYLVIR